MKRFRVTGLVTIPVLTDVDAPSAAQAKELVESRPLVTLCKFCLSSDGAVQFWIPESAQSGEVISFGVEEIV